MLLDRPRWKKFINKLWCGTFSTTTRGLVSKARFSWVGRPVAERSTLQGRPGFLGAPITRSAVSYVVRRKKNTNSPFDRFDALRLLTAGRQYKSLLRAGRTHFWRSALKQSLRHATGRGAPREGVFHYIVISQIRAVPTRYGESLELIDSKRNRYQSGEMVRRCSPQVYLAVLPFPRLVRRKADLSMRSA